MYLDDEGGGVAASHDDEGPGSRGGNGGGKDGLGTLREPGELKHTGGAVPDDGLGGLDHLGEPRGGLGAHIETHPPAGKQKLLN